MLISVTSNVRLTINYNRSSFSYLVAVGIGIEPPFHSVKRLVSFISLPFGFPSKNLLNLKNKLHSFLYLVVSWVIYRWISLNPLNLLKTRSVWWISCNLISLWSLCISFSWSLNDLCFISSCFNYFYFFFAVAVCISGRYRWSEDRGLSG